MLTDREMINTTHPEIIDNIDRNSMYDVKMICVEFGPSIIDVFKNMIKSPLKENKSNNID